MDITLPEALESIVRRRVEEGGYASAEEYVRDLILSDSEPSPEWQRLTDQERMAVEQIDQELLKALDSGPPMVADDAYWENLKRRARERTANGS